MEDYENFELDSVQPFYGDVYRYRNVNTDQEEERELEAVKGSSKKTNRQRIADLISRNIIYAAKPSQLNDPFECFPSTPLSGVTSLRKAFEQAIKETDSSISRVERKKFAQELALQNADPVVRAQLIFDAFDRDLGVISFSKSWENLSQWAYYGGDHSGICLEFSIKDGEQWWSSYKGPKFAGLEVIYADNRPEFDVAKIAQDRNKKYTAVSGLLSVLSKSKYWEREEEVRLITIASGEMSYPSVALTGVYLGCRMLDDQRDFVLDCIKNSDSNPIVYECTRDLSRYGLGSKDIKFDV